MPLINELAPIGEKREWVKIPVPKNKNGKACNCCGRCCAIIGISEPLKYFKDHIKKWNAWARENTGKDEAKIEERGIWAREYKIMLKYWRRLPRREVVARGQEIHKGRYYYICLALKKEGNKYICSVHGEDKPYVCREFPYYTYTHKMKTSVLKGCSFVGGNNGRKQERN